MTAAVKRLRNKNLVERIKDPSDGRCFYLHLTPSGRNLINCAYEKHAQNLEKLASVLSPGERRELVRLLKKIGLHAHKVRLV